MDENQLEKNTGGASPQAREARGDRDYFLPISILVAGLMVSASIVYLVSRGGSAPALNGQGGAAAVAGISPKELEKELVVGTRDVLLGDPKAPITIIEYGDYQCPFCGRFFTDTELLIRKEYVDSGKVRMVYRNFAFLGQESTAAAEAAECAKDQKKFWVYHDAIYKAEIRDGQENNGNLTRDALARLAGDAGLDSKAFAACVDGKKYADSVRKELEGGRKAGVDSTPTFFINGQMLRGALPYADDPRFGTGFKTIIEAVLKGSAK